MMIRRRLSTAFVIARATNIESQRHALLIYQLLNFLPGFSRLSRLLSTVARTPSDRFATFCCIFVVPHHGKTFEKEEDIRSGMDEVQSRESENNHFPCR